MSDFLNRITAQRQVINIVNRNSLNFPLVGLSAKSIERWKNENCLDEKSELLKVIYIISSKLFFLANKSQEQITDEYKLLSKNIKQLIDYLNINIKNWL